MPASMPGRPCMVMPSASPRMQFAPPTNVPFIQPGVPQMQQQMQQQMPGTMPAMPTVPPQLFYGGGQAHADPGMLLPSGGSGMPGVPLQPPFLPQQHSAFPAMPSAGNVWATPQGMLMAGSFHAAPPGGGAVGMTSSHPLMLPPSNLLPGARIGRHNPGMAPVPVHRGTRDTLSLAAEQPLAGKGRRRRRCQQVSDSHPTPRTTPTAYEPPAPQPGTGTRKPTPYNVFMSTELCRVKKVRPPPRTRVPSLRPLLTRGARRAAAPRSAAQGDLSPSRDELGDVRGQPKARKEG